MYGVWHVCVYVLVKALQRNRINRLYLIYMRICRSMSPMYVQICVYMCTNYILYMLIYVYLYIGRGRDHEELASATTEL